MSVPRSHADHPTDSFPDECEVAINKLVDTCLPHLSGRKLINRAMCWCTDTADAALLICEHPKWKNLILATGDSGCVLRGSGVESSYSPTATRSNCYPTLVCTLSSCWKEHCQRNCNMRGGGDPEVMPSSLDEPLMRKTSPICPAGGMTVRGTRRWLIR